MGIKKFAYCFKNISKQKNFDLKNKKIIINAQKHVKKAK